MRDTRATSIAALLTALAALAPPVVAQQPIGPAPGNARAGATKLGAQPLSFEEHREQAGGPATFVSRGKAYTLALTGRDATLAVAGAGSSSLLRLRLEGATPRRPEGLDALPGKTYYVSGRPSSIAGQRTFRRVKYANVYPGIDAIFHGDDGRLEFDFVIAPHADPGPIRLELTGAEKLRLEPDGDLAMRVGGEEVRLKKPFIYQEIANERREVGGAFVLDGRTVRFALDAYDTARPLVIDPVVVFASYLGSAADERIVSVQTDSQGNVYVFGRTLDRTTFPTTASIGTNFVGTPKCFVTAFDPTGEQLRYSALFIDSYVVNNEAACDAMKVTPDGRVAVLYTATTFDPFAKTIRVIQEQNGSLISHAGFRAPHLEGLLPARAIDLDTANNVYAIGTCFNTRTQSPTPIYEGGFREDPWLGGNCESTDDLFGTGPSESVLAKYDSAGATGYATFIGGSTDDENTALALTVDDNGIANVTGRTRAGDFPVTPSAFQPVCPDCVSDAFFMQVDTNQSNQVPGQDSLVYSSYLGGSADDIATAIHADANGLVSVAGSTSSFDFADQQQAFTAGAFVARFDLSQVGAAQLERLTLFPFGETLFHHADKFAFFDDGRFAISGVTLDPAFPLVDELPIPSNPSVDLPFVSVFAADGSTLLFSTFLAPDASGVPRIAALGSGGLAAGLDSEVDLLATPDAYQQTIAGGVDLLLMRIDMAASPANQPPQVFIFGPVVGFADSPLGAVLQYFASVADPEDDPVTFSWSGPFSDSPVTTGQFLTARLPIGLQQTVSVTVQDDHGNSAVASITVDVVPNTPAGGPASVTPPDQAWANFFGGPIQFPVTVHFSDVTVAGTTSLRTRYVLPPVPPPGLQFGSPPLHYDLASQAGFTGPLQVCVDYRGQSFPRPAADVHIYQQVNGAWVALPEANDTTARSICGTTTTLGTFALFTPAVAANAITLIAGQPSRATCEYNGGPDPNDGGFATDSVLCSARDLAYDGAANQLYFAEDGGGDRIRRIDLATNRIWTVAGNGFHINSLPPGDPRDDDRNHVDPLTAPMADPLDVALDAAGNLYIAEYGANRLRKVDFASNTIFTIAGGGAAPCPFPGNSRHPLCASVSGPSSLVVDAAGAVLFTSFASATQHVFRITPGADGVVNGSADEELVIVAGDGSPNFDPSSVPAGGADPLSIALPAIGLALGPDGSLYAVGTNGSAFALRITPGPDGLIDGIGDRAWLVAGNPAAPNDPFLGDGNAATDARLFSPWSITVAPNGDVYVGDGGHFQAASVRRIDAVDGEVTGASDEIVTTVAGFHVFDPNIFTSTDLPFSDGDGHALSSIFGANWGLLVLPTGELLVSDTQQIRRIGPQVVQPPADADLSIVLVGTPGTVTAGDVLKYHVTITNAGPANATGVTMTYNIPAGAVFETTDSGAVTCSGPAPGTAGTVTCDFGSLASGLSNSIFVSVTAQAGGTLTSVFTVGATETDPNPANNSTSGVTTVELPPVAVTITETIVVSDTVAVLPAAQIGIVEAIVVNDAVGVLPAAMIGIVEQIAVVDAPGLTPGPVALVLAVTPASATNPVGDSHTVTAAISDGTDEQARVVLRPIAGSGHRAQFVNPGAADSPLSITTLGGNPLGGSDLIVSLATNANGALMSTAAHVVAAINASVGGALAAQLWPGSAGTGIVQPRPLSALTAVVFTVTGANPLVTSCATSVPGFCGVSYVGQSAGVDTIAVFLDQNGSGELDPGEPSASAQKTWNAVCAADVTAQVAIARGGFVFNPATRRFTQSVRVTNSGSAPLAGPVTLVLTNLSGNATLFNATGATTCAAPLGSPYLQLTAAGLPAGGSVTAVLQFTNPTLAGITYTPRVLAGTGTR